MDLILIILALLFLILGIVGCFMPAIPGPPLSFIGLLVGYFISDYPLSASQLWIFGILTVVVAALDYIIPIIGAKFTGSTKRGQIGSIIGLFLGLFIYPPFGALILTFTGAALGELSSGKNASAAFKAAAGSALGMMAGVMIKVALCVAMLIVFVLSVINMN
ncbi:MAG: DUF456 domain-containing protein [Chloroflexota bacterium]